MRDAGTSFTGSLVVHVLKPDGFVRIPVLPATMALENVTVNGKQSLVIAENGNHVVMLHGAGKYQVSVTFSVMSKIEDGPGHLELAILPTPITLLTMKIPLKDIDVEIAQAQKISSKKTDTSTTVWAVITQGSTIGIQWHRSSAPVEKIPAKFYGEVNYLVSIEDDVLSFDVDIDLNILHSEIKELQLRLPAGSNVLAITGHGIGDWHESTVHGERRITVPFTYGIKGNMPIHLCAEAALTETGLANAVSGIEVLGAVRETGSIGVELNTSAEVAVVSSDGLEPIAVQKLPGQLTAKSRKPLMYGFKYPKHPFELVLDVKKHKKVAVPVATITEANAVSLYTEDGKVVHRLVYQVRNNAKQFLEIQLPASADVWSIFVNGNPVECSINDDQTLLVPLIRSQASGNDLDTFPVAIIYCVVNQGFSVLGTRESSLPSVDLLVSQLIWSVYLPNDYSYLHFTSSLEIEEMIRGINALSSDKRIYNDEVMRKLAKSEIGEPVIQDADRLRQAYEGEGYESTFKSLSLQKPQIAGQLNAELEFSGRLDQAAEMPGPSSVGGSKSVGVLPIQIRIPTSGQVYRFARTIIRPDDPLAFSVSYSRGWVRSAMKWALALLLGALLWVLRKRLAASLAILGRWSSLAWKFVGEHRETVGRSMRAPIAVGLLSGLAVAAWMISFTIFVPLALLFWVCTSYQIIEFWKRRTARRSQISSTAE